MLREIHLPTLGEITWINACLNKER